MKLKALAGRILRAEFNGEEHGIEISTDGKAWLWTIHQLPGARRSTEDWPLLQLRELPATSANVPRTKACASCGKVWLAEPAFKMDSRGNVKTVYGTFDNKSIPLSWRKKVIQC